MKKVIIYALVLPFLLLIASSGCTKFVDEIKPETSQDVNSLRSSIRDLETVLNGGYAGVFSPAGMGLFIENVELQSDFYNINPAKRSSVLATGDSYSVYTHSYFSADAGMARYQLQWNGFTIYDMNFVIEAIDKGMVANDPDLPVQGNRMLGEGLAMRALAYWQQVLFFGPQYHSSTLNELAVVFRDWPILGPADIPAKRRTVGEMYDLIIKDLQRAIPLLPEAYDPAIHPLGFKMRMRKDFAIATLAKVYFQMNDFDNALTQVNTLLGPVSATGSAKYPLAADVKTIFSKISAPPYIDWGWKSTDANRVPEVIYGIDGRNAQKMTNQGKFGFMNTASPAGTPTLPGAKEYWRIGKPYVDLMVKGDTSLDQRWKKLVKRVRGSWWQNRITTHEMYYPLYRAAEFLLMRAEINARKNNLTDALTDLNVVRRRAGIPEFASASQAAIIQEIIDERGREMITESVRFFDMLRLSALSNGTFLVPLGEKVSDDKIFVSGADALPYNSPFFLFHFPSSEAQYNPGL